MSLFPFYSMVHLSSSICLSLAMRFVGPFAFIVETRFLNEKYVPMHYLYNRLVTKAVDSMIHFY